MSRPSAPRPCATRCLLLGAILLLAGACGGGDGRAGGPGGDDPFDPPAGPDRRLNTDPAGAELSIFPEICGAGERLYAVWYDRRAGNTDIHFNRSLDGGATWLDDDRRLDTDAPGAAGSNIPRLCCAGDRVYVAWSDQRGAGPSEIRFNRSLDAGATWLAADVRLDRDLPGPGSSGNVDVACEGDAVHVVWEDLRNGEPDVYYNRSLDAGATWLTEDVRLDTDVAGAAASFGPRIALCGSRLYVVWADDRDGEPDIRLNRSEDGGANWLAADVRLDTDPAGDAGSFAPVVQCEGPLVCAAWSDERAGRGDVHARSSSDGGATWLASDIRIDTDAPGAADSLRPALALRGDAVFVVWEEDRHGPVDVHFNRSVDGGTTWLPDDVRIDRDDPGSGNSFAPVLVATPTHLHVAWADDRSGAFDVLVRSAPGLGDVWTEKEVRLDTDEAGAANSLAPRLVGSGAEARVVWYDERDGPADVYFNRARAP